MPSVAIYDCPSRPARFKSKPVDSNLICDAFVLDGHSFPDDPKLNLKVTANRYRWGTRADRVEGVTVLFFHAIGCHKEQWEPIITRLFYHSHSTISQTSIREVWAFDRENHGDAAILNRGALELWPPCLPINEWAHTVADMIKTRLRGHRVVAVGHSAGAGVAMLTTKYAYDARISFAATVLVEPTIFTRKIFRETYGERISGIRMSEKVTLRRRDTWTNREEAFSYMKKRAPWSTWDEGVLRIYTEYGLRSTGLNGAVTLKCAKEKESAIYADIEGLQESAEIFEDLCGEVPIHVVWGGTHDFTSFSQQLKEDLLRPDSGRVPASVTVVPGGGHMVSTDPILGPTSISDGEVAHPL
ncbi:hypothetical protein V5O48_004449 [Marasmius crinis-equi]|uniref:AB hydrolase-1 domain-containing protein n=1 Tax=Marasmius crinis-equi TaxID=585013 RepID=A0ABR3FQ43_9AGAR